MAEEKKPESILAPSEYVTVYDKEGKAHEKLSVDARECVEILGWTRKPPVKASAPEKPKKGAKDAKKDAEVNDLLMKISECTSADEVNELVEGNTDERVTAAAAEKIEEIEG